jgi:hypothetical protein
MGIDRSRTSLTAFAPAMRDLDPDGWKAIGAKLWHERGMVVIGPGQLRSWADQQFVEQLAAALYGKRELKDG